LLVTDRGPDGQPVVEVAHEALLREWQRVATWVREFADDLRLRRQVESAAVDWRRAGGDPSHLWPHERLVQVHESLERLGIRRENLAEPAKSFVQPEAERLLAELELRETSHYRRAEIGDRLDRIGDPRPGVGLLQNGVPDIVWCEIPGGTVTLEGVEAKPKSRWRGAKAAPPGTFTATPFLIAKYPTTYRQYRVFLEDPEGYRDGRWWKDLRHERTPGEQYRPIDNCPAENVSWYDAVAYCRWLSARLGSEVRLPAEWEWQQAATGGRPDHEFPWGAEWEELRANTDQGHLGRTTAVGIYPRAVGLRILAPIAGNVLVRAVETAGPFPHVAIHVGDAFPGVAARKYARRGGATDVRLKGVAAGGGRPPGVASRHRRRRPRRRPSLPSPGPRPAPAGPR
jgi:hypothetical protein